METKIEEIETTPPLDSIDRHDFFEWKQGKITRAFFDKIKSMQDEHNQKAAQGMFLDSGNPHNTQSMYSDHVGYCRCIQEILDLKPKIID